MLLAILAIFGLAIVSPWVARAAGRHAGLLLATLPAALTVYFAAHVGPVSAGETFGDAHAWLPSLNIHLSFYLDGLSLIFALLICGIGSLVLLYAGPYLHGHAGFTRFFGWLLAFMGAMLGLVLSDNIITLFVFWELTSITSYMLIGFDHQRHSARAAALQSLLVTGGGGLAMMAGLIMLGAVGGSFELSELLSRGGTVRQHALYMPLTALVLVGAFTKSAQFPFHFWLPNAMEAPTPVSAYLHSSTMVKAGIYLMARLNPVLGATDLWQTTLMIVGGATMVIAAYLGYRQRMFKPILAYSTVATLGILTFLIGLGTPLAIQAAIAFLLAHALYKAALFLVAGTITHETDETNVDRLGGLGRAMPVTAVATGLAALSMIGLPPFFGYVAKEALFEAAWQQSKIATVQIAMTIVVAALLVAMTAMVGFLPFFGRLRSTLRTPHEPPWPMIAGPLILATAGLLFGIMQTVFVDLITVPAVSAVQGAAATAAAHAVAGHAEATGTSPIVWFEILAVGLGLLLFVTRNRLDVVLRAVDRINAVGPARWYGWTLSALDWTARTQTRLLQSGSLRRYMLITVMTTLLVVGYAVIQSQSVLSLDRLDDLTPYEAVVAGLIVIGTIGTVHSRSRLAAIASLGVVGYAVAWVFILFGAPDLALTQFVIETLTVILFVLVFYHLPEYSRFTSMAERLRDIVVALGAGGLMTALVLIASHVQTEHEVSAYFAEQSYPTGHGRNVVNVILVDFRALDTLGEITVLAISAVGVYALLKLRPQREQPE